MKNNAILLLKGLHSGFLSAWAWHCIPFHYSLALFSSSPKLTQHYSISRNARVGEVSHQLSPHSFPLLSRGFSQYSCGFTGTSVSSPTLLPFLTAKHPLLLLGQPGWNIAAFRIFLLSSHWSVIFNSDLSTEPTHCTQRERILPAMVKNRTELREGWEKWDSFHWLLPKCTWMEVHPISEAGVSWGAHCLN